MLAIKLPRHDERVESVVDDGLSNSPEPVRGDRPQALMMRWSADRGSLIARWTTTGARASR
jgi:hypothetical protein